MDDTPNTGRDQGQPPPDDAAPSNGGPSGERKLIEAAFEGAQPASGWPETSTAWFEGAPLPPHGAFPGYDIVREIHRGGQGVVYQAVQLSTRRHVAIKVMHSGPFMGSSGRARFEREVQVLGQLDHPNIVGIHDSGVTKDGSCFYVMDYISGKPLDKLLAEGQLPIRESLKLFAKICDAVNAAHLKGVIHRDLKPANIRIDKHGEPIVVDFGLAKLAIPDLDEEGSGKLMSMTGQFIGSLPWASPEQAEGSPTNIDVRTDVYSLGVILYQLLTNRFPYEVLGNMRDVLDNIVRAEPARPSTIRRKINDEVETIVLKSLAKQRERRYQSAGELGRDVHRFLEGQPIEAKRDSGWYVITKTLNRYRAPVAVAAGSLVALVVFAVVITVLYKDAKAARRIAEEKTTVAEAATIAEAEQRQLAEDRLENAYDMASTMLTEFYDAIRDLRGATEAKLALAESAMGTLDELEGEAAGDPQRTLLIGRGRLRLGMLYAGRGESHRVGGFEDGRALYEKALRAANELLDVDGDSFEARRLRADALAALAHAYRLSRDFTTATDRISDAIDAYSDAIDAAPPGSDERDKAFLSRAEALLEQGSLYVDQSQMAEDDDGRDRLLDRADTAFDRGLSGFETLRDSAAGVTKQKAAQGVAQALIRQAERHKRRASLAAEAPDSMDRAFSEIDRAEAKLEAAVAELEALAAELPADGAVAQSRFVALDSWGDALELRARLLRSRGGEDDSQRAQAESDRVLTLLGMAIEQAGHAADIDQTNVLLPRVVAHLLDKRARTLQAAGRTDEAQADYTESIRLREALVKTDLSAQHLNDAAVGWFRLGAFREAMAAALEDGEKREMFELAEDAFVTAETFARRQIDLGVSPDNTHLKAIQSRIDSVREQLSPG